MFTVSMQKKDSDKFVTVQTLKLESFDNTVADKAINVASSKGLYLQMYIAHSDTVPVGYSSKVLEYTTCIWKNVTITASDALSALDSIPF
jgi:hypothetical protein